MQQVRAGGGCERRCDPNRPGRPCQASGPGGPRAPAVPLGARRRHLRAACRRCADISVTVVTAEQPGRPAACMVPRRLPTPALSSAAQRGAARALTAARARARSGAVPGASRHDLRARRLRLRAPPTAGSHNTPEQARLPHARRTTVAAGARAPPSGGTGARPGRARAARRARSCSATRRCAAAAPGARAPLPTATAPASPPSSSSTLPSFRRAPRTDAPAPSRGHVACTRVHSWGPASRRRCHQRHVLMAVRPHKDGWETIWT